MTRGFALSLLILAVGPISSADAQERNRSIPNVEDQFRRLKHHAEVLGFRIGNHPFDLGGASHWQGVQRWGGPGAPHLFLSHSSNDSEVKEATLVVVRMSSRDGDGERMRSNRLVHGAKTQDSPPPPQDTIVARIPFPDYQHGGGMQLVGNVLAVPLEERNSDDIPEGVVFFFDVSNPALPVRFGQLEFPEKVGVVALTDLPDGRYLMATAHGNGQVLEFFRSNGSDWRAPGFAFEHLYSWQAAELRPEGQAFWPYSVDSSTTKMISSHQTLNFVKQNDGKLFLIGSHNTHNYTPAITGDHVAVLYRVDGFGGSGPIVLTEVLGRHFMNESPGADNDVNFNAGGGAYVSPTGELILYATEHYVDGPGDSVELGEIRDVDVYRPDNPRYKPRPIIEAPEIFEGSSVVLDGSHSLPAGVRAWVELYADADGWRPRLAKMIRPEGGVLAWEFDTDKPDRSLMVDLADHFRDDFDDFGKLDQSFAALPSGFHDTASSLRWYAPPGCGIFLAEHDSYDGKRLELNDGLFPSSHLRAAALPDLKAQQMCDEGGCADADDEASSVFFHENCASLPPPLGRFSWSGGLSSDGSLIGDTEAPTVSFSAEDGPSEVEVRLTVCHADDWCEKTVRLLPIRNVAPSVDAGKDRSVTTGADVRFDGRFTDPGRDSHTIEWDFGDGTTAEGSLTPTHRYTQAGTYAVKLKVTDDDQAATTDVLKVVVADADPPPVVDAGPDLKAVEGSPVAFHGDFDDSGPGTGHQILWNFGDGSTAQSLLDPVYTYRDNGTYLVTLTVIDAGGHADSDSLTVTVANAAPTATFTIFGSSTLECAGAATENPMRTEFGLSHTDPGSLDTHTAWILWGDGGRPDALAGPPWHVPFHTYSKTGQFALLATVADDDGGMGSASATLNVVDTVPPSFGPLVPAPVTIPASDPNGTPYEVRLPQASDACSVAIVASDSPGIFPVGTTTVNFTATDAAGNSATSSTTVTVTNRPPLVPSLLLTTAEDSPLRIALAASDPDGHKLEFKLSSLPGHGTLLGTAPALEYVPAKDFNGEDSFLFGVSDGFGPAVTAVVSITVTPVNDPPSANSETLLTDEDTPLRLQLSGSDVDGDALQMQPHSRPAHGTLVTASHTTSQVLYTPDANWSGTDSFEFVVGDGTAMAFGTITIRVAPVNDPPVALPIQATTSEGVPVPILLAGADIDGDSLTFLVTAAPANGTLSGAPPRLTYTPKPGFSGGDSFSFVASDGVASSTPALALVLVTPDPDGRLYGEGRLDERDVEHRFEFRAFDRKSDERGRLNYTRQARRDRDRFEATEITAISFSDDPALDSVIMTGLGTWNGESGYSFVMRAADAGEPGRGRDRFEIVVTAPNGSVMTRVGGTLDGGNVQSKRVVPAQCQSPCSVKAAQ